MKRRFEALIAVMAWLAVAAIGCVLASGAVAATSPSVVTGSASHITDTSALLQGTVNPNGNGTTYYFQWGLTPSYGVNGKAESAGTGTKPVSVQETASSLIPGTVYHFRLVATNHYGTTVGADHTFTTAGHAPPDVATGPATNISQTGATLTGVVNPRGQATSWVFQLGADTNYGLTTNPGSVPASSSATSVSTAVGIPLKPGTIYHYRLVASHGTGNTTVEGADAIFMTYPHKRPVPHVHAASTPHRLRHRPYRLVTAGFISHPGWIPSQFACTGNVEIRFRAGRHFVAASFVPIAPDCTYTSQIVFAHRHRRLSIHVRFEGNGYLAPNHAATEHVAFGR
jgi:hypothetical protein